MISNNRGLRSTMQWNFGDKKQSKVQVSYEISKNHNILHQESPTIP